MADPRAKELLFDALELPAAERRAFLDEACGGDAALRDRVRSLLAAHGEADERLGVPPTVRLPTVTDGPLPGELAVGDDVGPYHLDAVLGEGGFGTVFRASQTEPVRREVALKVLKAGMDSRAVIARFGAEQQALALMDHPHVARVLDAGSTAGGRPYFVMELIDGTPITDHCDAHDLSLRERLALFALVCRAVQHAHGKGVIHRDIKPGNVLVTEVDGEPQPKVIDFGVAKAVRGSLVDDASLTRQGHVVGTPASMSPEQVAGSADVDIRADVYGLGVLLYELVTGAPPFDLADTDLVELCRKVREDDPPRPSVRRRESTDVVASGEGLRGTGSGEGTVGWRRLPPEVDWIVMRCLEKQRERRYPTALDLALDLERLLDGRPVEAAPPSTFYRVSKLARRHQAAALAAMVTFLAVVVGVTGLATGLTEAKRANTQLDAALLEARREAERARVAEQDAAAAADRARDQEQVARAVLAFVTDDLLGAAAPSNRQGEGRDARLSEVLAVADRRLRAGAASGRFDDTPLVEGGVRHALGSTLAALGEFAEAEQHLRAALALRRTELGDDHADTLDSELALAKAVWSAGRIDEAAALAEHAHDRLLATRGAGDARRLDALTLLGLLRWDQGDPGRGAELLAQAATGLAEHHGSDHELSLHALAALALDLHALGRDDDAEALLRDVLARRERVLGADDPLTLATRVNLADMLRGAGRLQEAMQEYEASLEGFVQVMGAGHADALMAGQGLGRLYLDLGRLDEGAALLADLREQALASLGPEHLLTLELTAGLGSARQLQGRLEDALALYREAHAGARATLAPGHPFLQSRAQEVGAALFGLARYAEAEPVMRAVLAAEREALGERHPATLRAQMNLAIVLIGLQRTAEAEVEMRAAHAGLVAGSGPDAAETLEVQSNLVGLLLELERFDEALALADDGLARLRRLTPEDTLPLAALRLRRGAALTGLARFEQAEAELLEVEAILRPRWALTPFGGDVLVRLEQLYAAWGREAARAHWQAERDAAFAGQSAGG